MLTNYNVIDFAENYDVDLWKSTLDVITKSDDKLKNNYLNINFNDFITFDCVVNHGIIICFSGLQYDVQKWGSKIARCSSRMWIHPNYRHKTLTKFPGGPEFLNTTYCLPRQVAAAKKRNLDCIFISRENKIRGFSAYLNLIKINCGVTFTLDENKYYVCGPVKHDSCLQHVALHFLTNQGTTVWELSMAHNKFF